MVLRFKMREYPLIHQRLFLENVHFYLTWKWLFPIFIAIFPGGCVLLYEIVFWELRFEYIENIENISNESKMLAKVSICLEIRNNSLYLI